MKVWGVKVLPFVWFLGFAAGCLFFVYVFVSVCMQVCISLWLLLC